jgi:hypothetical protein
MLLRLFYVEERFSWFQWKRLPYAEYVKFIGEKNNGWKVLDKQSEERFRVLTAVAMKSSVFWDHCVVRWKSTDVSEELFASIFKLFASFLLDFLFDPEDGGGIFLLNVAWLSPDYMTPYTRRYNVSVGEKLDIALTIYCCRHWNSIILHWLVGLYNEEQLHSGYFYLSSQFKLKYRNVDDKFCIMNYMSWCECLSYLVIILRH